MRDMFSPDPLPLYARLASILRERIRASEWPPGSQLPTIDELRLSYQVAEITMRQAVRTLVNEGLLISRRGKGTFVNLQPRTAEPTPIDTAIEQFSALDLSHRILILQRERGVPAPTWDWQPGIPAKSYVRILKIHADAAGCPYAMFHMYVESTLYRRLPPKADEKDKIIRLVRNSGGVKIASAKERMTVGIAEFHETELLSCPAGLPVARIRRVFLDERDVVQVYGAITYRGDKLIMERDFTSTANAQSN